MIRSPQVEKLWVPEEEDFLCSPGPNRGGNRWNASERDRQEDTKIKKDNEDN